MKRLLLALPAAVLLLAGCANDDAAPSADAPSPDAPSTVAPSADALLADYDLAGLSTTEVVDRLDRLGGEDRPADLMASVRVDEVLLTKDDQELSIPIPEDRFYLSVAPYVDQTHECFYHSLTTCTGELDGRDVDVRIVDDTHGEVLVDETVTTFDNGFVGFWLPRDIEGTLQISYEGRTAETAITTDADAPTCLTTVQLT